MQKKLTMTIFSLITVILSVFATVSVILCWFSISNQNSSDISLSLPEKTQNLQMSFDPQGETQGDCDLLLYPGEYQCLKVDLSTTIADHINISLVIDQFERVIPEDFAASYESEKQTKQEEDITLPDYQEFWKAVIYRNLTTGRIWDHDVTESDFLSIVDASNILDAIQFGYTNSLPANLSEVTLLDGHLSDYLSNGIEIHDDATTNTPQSGITISSSSPTSVYCVFYFDPMVYAHTTISTNVNDEVQEDIISLENSNPFLFQRVKAQFHLQKDE